MPLVELLGRDATRSLSGFLFLSATAGLSSALVLAVLNGAAGSAGGIGAGTGYLLMFLLAVGVHALAQGGVMRAASREMEGILDRCRIRMAEAVLSAEPSAFAGIGATRIAAGMARETRTLSETQTVLIVGCQSALTILFTLLYVATVSMAAFVVVAGFVGAAVTLHFVRAPRVGAASAAALAAENRLFDRIRDLLAGFPAVRLNRSRDLALAAAIEREAEAAARHGAAMRVDAAGQYVAGQVGLFVLVALMVFVVPAIARSYSQVVVELTTAVLFIVGPIGMLVQAVPVVAQANAAAAAILALERDLAGLARDPAAAAETAPAPFKRITLEAAEFAYPAPGGESGFAVGPLDFGLRRRETVFLTGGNGSGKSTFLKLLTGLYRPSAGRLAVDGQTVGPEARQDHRDRFAAVFADFHLPRRLRGAATLDPDRAGELLRLVELDRITALEGDRFRRTDLSSGQRRRLMLVAALLENRPVLVLDEFAADLDPVFRKRFYEEILPRLRSAGTTVVAATHDERFFAVADRRLHMADGRFVPEPAT